MGSRSDFVDVYVAGLAGNAVVIVRSAGQRDGAASDLHRADLLRDEAEVIGAADGAAGSKALDRQRRRATEPEGSTSARRLEFRLELDDTTAVKILSLMKADIVGPIFEEMSKTATADGMPLARRAALLSEKLRLMKSSKQSSS